MLNNRLFSLSYWDATWISQNWSEWEREKNPKKSKYRHLNGFSHRSKVRARMRKMKLRIDLHRSSSVRDWRCRNWESLSHRDRLFFFRWLAGHFQLCSINHHWFLTSAVRFDFSLFSSLSALLKDVTAACWLSVELREWIACFSSSSFLPVHIDGFLRKSDYSIRLWRVVKRSSSS